MVTSKPMPSLKFSFSVNCDIFSETFRKPSPRAMGLVNEVGELMHQFVRKGLVRFRAITGIARPQRLHAEAGQRNHDHASGPPTNKHSCRPCRATAFVVSFLGLKKETGMPLGRITVARAEEIQ